MYFEERPPRFEVPSLPISSCVGSSTSGGVNCPKSVLFVLLQALLFQFLPSTEWTAPLCDAGTVRAPQLPGVELGAMNSGHLRRSPAAGAIAALEARVASKATGVAAGETARSARPGPSHGLCARDRRGRVARGQGQNQRFDGGKRVHHRVLGSKLVERTSEHHHQNVDGGER